ncbi:ABC transporter substrate-binding protein [Arthrobacter sp. R3-55]
MKSLHKSALIPTALLISGLALAGCASPAAEGAATAGCTPAHPDMTTVTKGTLKVSVLVTPPYSELGAGGENLGGVDGEIVKAIAKKECLEVKATPVDGPALLKSVDSKRADVAIGGIYFTEERAAQLNLSSTMYRDGMAILSPAGLSSLADLQGNKIGVIQGYLWNKDLSAVLGNDNVTQYPDAAGLISDLKSGRIKAGIFTTAESSYRVTQDSQFKSVIFKADDQIAASTKPGNVVLASTKGNETLSKAFNENITALLADGTIAKILKDNGIDESLAGAAK